jgi:hypothetical protein
MTMQCYKIVLEDAVSDTFVRHHVRVEIRIIAYSISLKKG